MFDIYGLDMVKKYENQILGTLPPWVSSTYLFILLALLVFLKKWCVVLFLSCRLLLATFQWMADHIPSKIKNLAGLEGENKPNCKRNKYKTSICRPRNSQPRCPNSIISCSKVRTDESRGRTEHFFCLYVFVYEKQILPPQKRKDFILKNQK